MQPARGEFGQDTRPFSSCTITDPRCAEQDNLRVRVSDDGVGGAQPEGSGLVGLADRVAALDGRLRVESPENGGTLIAADIPLPE